MVLLVPYIRMASPKGPRDQLGNANEYKGYINMSQDFKWLLIYPFVRLSDLEVCSN